VEGAGRKEEVERKDRVGDKQLVWGRV
jgi:hypothetical protein